MHDLDGVPVVVTYHPAYLLRSPGEKRKSWDDLKLALEVLRRWPRRVSDLAVAGWRLRPMAQADLPQVAALERASYAFPWNDQIFADCLRVGYHCVVVETAAGVSGYGVLSMGAGEAHVLNLCIAEDLRRRGTGRALLLALLVQARDRGVRDAFLEVRRSNRARDRALSRPRLRVRGHAPRLLPGAGRPRGRPGLPARARRAAPAR